MPSDKSRDDLLLFSPGRIGSMTVANRLVRSATWDPVVAIPRLMNDETVETYRRLASGGVGLIITGDFSVVPAGEDPERTSQGGPPMTVCGSLDSIDYRQQCVRRIPNAESWHK